MPELTIALDFELVRQIVLRLEEVWDSDSHSMPTDYVFDGYRVEIISHNIQKLRDAEIVFARAMENWSPDQVKSWPTGFTPDGWNFLAAAKDDRVWDEAVKTVEAQGKTANLRALKVALV
ncbi:MAG: DUF2513 domain-containing protein [Caldilineaceae bacterium]|nr:DUF2513 domain-containing protein [Caldilineaceae bacterium]